MGRFVDLHCHWVAGIDDGPRTPNEGREILVRLRALGFERVVATPHMRPGLFDNTRTDLEAAFATSLSALGDPSTLPELALSSEHYFDDIVFERLLEGNALPYPGNRAALLEFYEIDFPRSIERRFFELRQAGLLPVIAHPERYRCIWEAPDRLGELVDAGAVALLDLAALDGKYGKQPRQSARDLLERELYHAACSDAHRPADVDAVARGIDEIERSYGHDEVDFLLRQGPEEILKGTART